MQMNVLLTVQSRSHSYPVEAFPSFNQALGSATPPAIGTFCLADHVVYDLYRKDFDRVLPPDKVYLIDASEKAKSFESLVPVFAWLLQNSFKRDNCLLVVGGGVLQDIGCFVASVLFRGVRWELIPTTLLAQCDSCIGSKSSLNIQSFKNQIGTFFPPHRILLTHDVLKTLPSDEIRSGIGEVIKLHLLSGETAFEGLMNGLAAKPVDELFLSQCVFRSLQIKQPFIQKDEFDRGIRNLLNYGHTFGHAYESSTCYQIPHGIAVTLGVLTATFVSARLGMVRNSHFTDLKERLRSWHEPYGDKLKSLEISAILNAIKLDKKNTRTEINCILTRGPGQMEKVPLSLETQLRPALCDFIATEL